VRARKYVLNSVFAVATLVILGLAFSAPNATAGSNNNITPDAASISAKVRHDVAMLPWYGVFDDLNYQVNGTEVILGGHLVSEHDTTKSTIVNEVKRIPGVTNVVDNIEVLPVSVFDDQIRRAEYRSIFSKSDLGRYTLGPIPQVHIIVKNGHVLLEGVVMNQMDKTVAEIAAKSVAGVFSVTNDLRIG
jgi:hyperosmotically inducible protein